MGEWFINLPIWVMALTIFAAVYLIAIVIFAVVASLAKGHRGRLFRGVSPTLMSVLGTIFGLLVVFIGAQVWSDMDRAELAVDREASAMRMVTLLAANFPGDPENQIRTFVRQHIDEVVNIEWPMMANQSASLRVQSPALGEALQFVLSLAPKSEGQTLAQRELVTAIENGLDARRERIILSRARVNWIKWACLFAQATCIFVAIAIVHIDNRSGAAIAMGIFGAGVVVAVLLIASHDQPFSGEISVKPDVLLRVRPE